MASLQELKAVVKDTLETRGVLGQVKARIRAEVFNALDDQTEQPPPLSNENMLINELIKEYLEFNQYKYTASVLQCEAGLPNVPLDREFLTKEMNIAEDRDSASVPLLYGLVSHFLSRGKVTRSRGMSPSRVPRSFSPGRSRALSDTDIYPNERVTSHEPQPFVVRGGRR